MDNVDVDQLTKTLAIVAAVSVAYGRVFGSYQYQIVEWCIEAFTVKSKYKGLLNLGIGVALALAFGLIVAYQVGNYNLLPLGTFAGLLASVEAGKVHDGKVPAEDQKPTPEAEKKD